MNALTDLKTAGMSLAPTNLSEAMKFAELMSKSSIVPKDYQGNPGNVLVAVQWGMEVGLQPLQAMQNIAVINGRPSLWGDALLALVQSSGLLESFHEEVTDTGATCTVKRRGMPEAKRTFTLEDAKKAGLLGKQGPWSNYPKRMMQLRARAFAMRDMFADVLRGMSSAEELSDMVAAAPEKNMGEVEVVRHESKTSAVKDKIRRSKATQDAANEPAQEAPEQTQQATYAVIADYINACEEAEKVQRVMDTRLAHLPDDQQAELRKLGADRIAVLAPADTTDVPF